MSNWDTMNDFIQHNNIKSIYRKQNKLDFDRLSNILRFIPEMLYYTYHNESEQNLYKINNAPKNLNNKKYDNYYKFRTQILFNIKSKNFYVEQTYADCKKRLNSLIQFDLENTMVIRYIDADKYSFAIQVLRCLRNTIAHGGYNWVIDNNNLNIVMLNNHDKGISFSYRYIYNQFNEKSEYFLENLYVDFLKNSYSSKMDLLISNLKLLGFQVIEYSEFVEKNNFYLHISKHNISSLFIECSSKNLDDLFNEITILLNVDEIKSKVILKEISEIKIYLSEYKSNYSKEKFIENIKNIVQNKLVRIDVCKNNDNLMKLFEF